MEVVLEASDGTKVTVPVEVVKLSRTLADMLEDLLEFREGEVLPEEKIEIPLPNVDSPTLIKVVEWMNHHYGQPPVEERKIDDKYYIPPWDAEFFNVDQKMLFDIIMAANYLNIEPLSDLAYKVVANMITGKSTEEIRAMFNIRNDFTPEEEEQVKRENAWMLE